MWFALPLVQDEESPPAVISFGLRGETPPGCLPPLGGMHGEQRAEERGGIGLSGICRLPRNWPLVY